jgi:hypothetical protein
MTRAWAVFTAQVFLMRFGSVPRVFPGDLYEGFVKFLRRPIRVVCRTLVRAEAAKTLTKSDPETGPAPKEKS